MLFKDQLVVEGGSGKGAAATDVLTFDGDDGDDIDGDDVGDDYGTDDDDDDVDGDDDGDDS